MAEAFEAQLKALRDDHRNVALPWLAFVYAALAALVGAAAFAPWWWFAVVFVPIGLLQYQVVISGHEAVHRTLCWPAWLNELLGVGGQALVGVNFASYRVQHLEHHVASGVGDDPDGHIYGPIVRARRGMPRLLTWTLGTFTEIAVKVVQKGVGSVGTNRKPRSQVASRDASAWHTAIVALAQLALLLGLWAATRHFWAYFALWIGPLFGVAVFLNRTRILVEHGLPLVLGLEAKRGLATIDLDPPAWQRMVLAPFRFNHHGAHHLHMTVPHYNLPRLAAVLRDHGPPGFHHHEGSYVSALVQVLRS